MMKIFETKNYEEFKRLSGNREVDSINLKNIKEAILKKNNLHLHPIIVNKDKFVIDGHHRLEIARQLNLPIYFMIDEEGDENCAYDHIITANVNKKNWMVEDFLHLYATKDKNPHYIEFLDLMDSLQLSVKALIGLIIGRQSPNLIREMKMGKFAMPSNKETIEKITLAYFQFRDFAEERKIKPKSMFTNSYFTNAFRMLMLNGSCVTEVFFQKLENRWFLLKPQPNSNEWLQLLLSIYNWKNHNKIEVEE